MEQEIEDIILKHLSNQASAEENNALLRWINDSKANKRKFDAMKYTWEASSFITKPITVDANEAYSRVKGRIQLDQSSARKKTVSQPFQKKLTLSTLPWYWMMVLLLLASMAWLLWEWLGARL